MAEHPAREFAKMHKLDYFETSAKTGAGVTESFQHLGELVLER